MMLEIIMPEGISKEQIVFCQDNQDDRFFMAGYFSTFEYEPRKFKHLFQPLLSFCEMGHLYCRICIGEQECLKKVRVKKIAKKHFYKKFEKVKKMFLALEFPEFTDCKADEDNSSFQFSNHKNEVLYTLKSHKTDCLKSPYAIIMYCTSNIFGRTLKLLPKEIEFGLEFIKKFQEDCKQTILFCEKFILL